MKWIILQKIIPMWLNIYEPRVEKKLLNIIITVIYDPNTLLYRSTLPIEVHFGRQTMSQYGDVSWFCPPR